MSSKLRYTRLFVVCLAPCQVVAPLLRVLHSLHQLGIIHRDIKPENIFFQNDGTLRLGDFGLAINATKERPISRVGTLDYMAPEVCVPHATPVTHSAHAASDVHVHEAHGMPVGECHRPVALVAGDVVKT